MTHRSRSAFTIIELIVVVSVLAILAGALIPRVTNHLAEARDERRMSDIRAIQAAIERFHADRQRYPDAQPNSNYGGWDVTNDGEFIPELVASGYLPRAVLDPSNDARYFYSYHLYDESTAGCRSTGKFYVLGIKAFESSTFAARDAGSFRCSDRDWSRELAYVCGGGAQQTDGNARP